MPAEKTERNAEIIALYAQGWSQRQLGEKYGISQSTIKEIIGRYRVAQGPIDKAEAIHQQVDTLDHIARLALEIAEDLGAPVFREGGFVEDPATGKLVRAHSDRLAAMNAARAALERKAKLLGLDSATKVETSGSVTYHIEGLDPDALK